MLAHRCRGANGASFVLCAEQRRHWRPASHGQPAHLSTHPLARNETRRRLFCHRERAPSGFLLLYLTRETDAARVCRHGAHRHHERVGLLRAPFE